MSQASGLDEIEVETIRSTARWDAIGSEWHQLFAGSPAAAFPLCWAWLRGWWRIYSAAYADKDGLRILTARRGGRLVGALPLYIARLDRPLGLRRLRFVSTGEREFEETCPDYLDVLYAPGEGDHCAAAFWRHLTGEDEGRAWDELELSSMPEHSPLLARPPHAFGREPIVSRLGVCPLADLSGGFEAYSARLSTSRRAFSRKLIRVADGAGAEFAVASDQPTAQRFFEELVALHQARWTAADKPGCFAAPRFTAFLRSLVTAGAADGSAAIARLSIAGRPVAVVCGFRTGTKFDFYQCGIDCTNPGPIQSPGLTAHFLLMRALADQGVTTYDFLRGTSAYKQRLSTASAALSAIRVTRPNVRTAMHKAAGRASGQLRRAARTGIRLFKKSPPADAVQA